MSSSQPPKITTILSQPFGENTYILGIPGRSDCVVVDPGFEPDKIFAELDTQNLVPAAILNTHGHSDHIAGNEAMKQRWPDCPLVIGHGDAHKLTDPRANLSAMFGGQLISPTADVMLAEGDTYESAGMAFRVLETPGHSAGHIVFVLKSDEPTLLIGGDMLFRQGIGRTDFPDGDPAAMVHSIRTKLYTLPDSTVVYPGHGPETTIGYEKENNPFVPAT
ncbi:MBL fold metallo-hydrolase [Aeoliella sp. ICT_H6.2]|uniref:MBL fold metallo-hydrolase n=1 Tax=Aeoliella straminimaris TaxID=2954799 RepID=A0A9X2FA74_9BACT|nr:MBL fold metallo-hydrolase [Aeoliella straminimaris]